jgi:hydrogenase maturation factor HypF (carbamoyltransferase family)
MKKLARPLTCSGCSAEISSAAQRRFYRGSVVCLRCCALTHAVETYEHAASTTMIGASSTPAQRLVRSVAKLRARAARAA